MHVNNVPERPSTIALASVSQWEGAGSERKAGQDQSDPQANPFR